ncbi:hypothetical protein BGX38DRAFT_1277167 [Terfezia claveryi]|nr:hypothetical protein BGX38DRAFT_1277167 [Terfezia claveryi]
MDEREQAPKENEFNRRIKEARVEALEEDINEVIALLHGWGIGDQAQIGDYQKLNGDIVAKPVSKANTVETMEERPVVHEETLNNHDLDNLADLFSDWKPEERALGQKRNHENLSKEDDVVQQGPESALREPKRRCRQRQRAPPPPPPPELVPDFEVLEPPPRERKRARHQHQKVGRPSQPPLNLEPLIPGHRCGEINLSNNDWPVKWSSTRRASDIYYDVPTADYDSGNWPDNPRLTLLMQEVLAEQAEELAQVVDEWIIDLELELAQEPIALGDVEMVSRGVEEQVQDMLHAQVLREQDEWEERMRGELAGEDRSMRDAGETGRPWDSQLRAENAFWVWGGRNE